MSAGISEIEQLKGNLNHRSWLCIKITKYISYKDAYIIVYVI